MGGCGENDGEENLEMLQLASIQSTHYSHVWVAAGKLMVRRNCRGCSKPQYRAINTATYGWLQGN